MGGFCKCCGLPPPECPNQCCDPEEQIPIQLQPVSGEGRWTKVNTTYDADCCCYKETWQRNPEYALVHECCDLAGFYSYLMTGVRKDYGWKKWAWLITQQTQCCPPVCPSADDCCAPDPPELISEWTETWEDTLNYFFTVKFYLDTITIIWGREEILCPGDTEPQCRYFVKTLVNGHYDAAITTQRVTHRVKELTYLHPCFEYTGTSNGNGIAIDDGKLCEFDETIVKCASPGEVCEIDNPVQDCLDLRESDPEGPSNCWLNSDSFCFERIRFFDEPPEGLINFTDSDILLDSSAYCEPPECNNPCFAGGYVTQISVVSVNSVIPPEWYTSPPILETTTTTYVIDWNFCNDTQGGTATCCPDDEPAFCSTNCPDVSCTIPTIEIDVTCQSFTRPTSWTNADSAIGCDFNSWYLDGTAESGTGKDDITGSLTVNNAQGCLFIEDAGVGGAQWPISHCIQPKPTTSTNPCEPADCYQSWSCGGCQCGCLQLYPAYVAFSSNTLTFEADGSWTQQECIYQVPNIPVNISY